MNENSELSRFNLALELCGGDENNARKMISGEYTDLKALKCRLSENSTGTFGGMIFFIKSSENTVLSASVFTFSDKLIFDKISPADPWKTFYSNIIRLSQNTQVSENPDLRNHMISSFEGFDVYPDIQASDIPSVSDKIEQITDKFLNSSGTSAEIEIEPLSSLSLYESKIPMLQKQQSSSRNPESDNRPDIEKEADFVMESKVIVSPVKGKYINDIRPGEMIKLLPLKDSALARKIAQAQKALGGDGEILPLRGRVKSVYPQDKGYIIYCIIGKKILAKITEEENVKIETDSPGIGSRQQDKEKTLYLYIILLLGLILISVFIIYALI